MSLLLASLLLSGGLPVTEPAHCHGLQLPPSAAIVRPFTPTGRWSGHWGLDIASPISDPVPAIGEGVVVFAGGVVDRLAVTVDHGGGLRSSYSYLASVDARVGDRITAGRAVGRSGIHDGEPAYHLSLRVNGSYVDPVMIARCRRAPVWGVYLTSEDFSYARPRVRALRRHVRPATCRTSRPGERRHRSARLARGAVPDGR